VFFKVAGIQLFLGLSCLVVVRTFEAPWTYILGSVLVALSGLYSVIELEKRIGIKDVIRETFKSFRKNN
jgi:hypothetical protein